MALFTAVLSFVVWLQFIWLTRQEDVLRQSVAIADKAANAASATVLTMEETARKELRAYIHVSPVPPGLNLKVDEVVRVALNIKNYGKTPGLVTDQVVKFQWFAEGHTLPHEPDYSGAQSKDASVNFVGVEHEFFRSTDFGVLTRGFVDHAGGTNYVFGYVDYMDVFGGRYRCGFARQFNPDFEDRGSYTSDADFAARNNLMLVSKLEYDYDRRRKKGEGNDWDTTFES